MKRFGDYILSLLPGFLRRRDGTKTDIEAWAQAMGMSLDELKQAIFKVRRLWLIETATGQALDLHGQDRNMPRLPGESDDSYRRRLKAAFQTYALGGTNAGLIEVLKIMGYPDARIRELYKDGIMPPLHNNQVLYNGAVKHDGGVRWAEFRITMGIEDNKDYSSMDRRALVAAINKTKASHSKLSALALGLEFNDRLALQEQTILTTCWSAEDGTAGPILLHTGVAPYGIRHDGKAFYQSGRIRDAKPNLTASMETREIFPGNRTHRVAYKHDGCGSRYRHSGSLLRKGFWHHDGHARHNGQLRYRDGVAHYGDKELVHAGLIRYGSGIIRNGSITYGANGMSDELHLIVRRKGLPIEIDVA